MLIKMLKRRRTDESLLNSALGDIYPDEHEFLVNDRRHTRHRVPAYKAAIIRVCQLQLKLCSKMMELRSASNSRHSEEPSTLKRIARKSILRHSLRNRTGTISLLESDESDKKDFDIRDVLPGELIDYLRDGSHDE